MTFFNHFQLNKICGNSIRSYGYHNFYICYRLAPNTHCYTGLILSDSSFNTNNEWCEFKHYFSTGCACFISNHSILWRIIPNTRRFPNMAGFALNTLIGKWMERTMQSKHELLNIPKQIQPAEGLNVKFSSERSNSLLFTENHSWHSHSVWEYLGIEFLLRTWCNNLLWVKQKLKQMLSKSNHWRLGFIHLILLTLVK